MKTVLLLSICLAMCACRVHLTSEAREIVVVKKPADLPSGCEKGETFVAQSKFGAGKALNSIRNKVAAQHAGDTLLLVSTEYGFAPGAKRISVMAFTCGKWWEANPGQLDKASKCAAKGGVWGDGQCVVPVE